MNWDISIGHAKQLYGRALQGMGNRLSRRKLVLDGEAIEYAGRLQTRYGTLKHHVQWNSAAVHLGREPIRIKKSLTM